MEKIALATVGSGKIVRSFLEGCREKCPEIRHQAVYSRTRERGEAFAAEVGLPPEAVWTDLNALARSGEVQAVYIATPNRFHAEQAAVFLEAGVHVLCEKPAAVTEKELERLYALAEAHHVVFMEGIMAPHQPRFAALQAAVARAGKLSSAVFEFSQLSSRYPALERGEMPNVFNPALCEGALMDIGYYGVYLAAALFGEPEEVFARATFLPTGADGAGSAVFRYGWGNCLLNWSKVSQTRSPSEILGDKGTVTFFPVSRILDLSFWDSAGRRELLFGEESHEASLGNEAADFARYILHPEETAAEYRRHLETGMLACRLTERMRGECGICFPG